MRLVLNLQNLLPMFSLDDSAKLMSQAGFDASDFYFREMTEPDNIFN